MAGAVFLVYLAITTLRSAKEVASNAPRRLGARSPRRTFTMAVLTNLANPKVVLFFAAFFPQFLTTGGWPTPAQFLVMGAILLVVG